MSTYFRYSRTAYYAVVAALPLLIGYELLLTLSDSVTDVQVRNAADVWLRMLLVGLGISPSKATLVMIVGMILSIPLFRSGSVRLVAGYFGLMLVEAIAYGFTLGIVINYILAFLFALFQPAYALVDAALHAAAMPLQGGFLQGLALSLGAGLFEELVFRVLLLSALLYVTRLFLQGWASAAISIVLAAFLFSLAHYLGPLGETLQLHSFLFRWVAGLLFTVLYYLRGFAITAYAHAIYDVWVITGILG